MSDRPEDFLKKGESLYSHEKRSFHGYKGAADMLKKERKSAKARALMKKSHPGLNDAAQGLMGLSIRKK